MKWLHTLAAWGGLAVIRGAWAETAGCLAVVIASSFLAAVWEPTG